MGFLNTLLFKGKAVGSTSQALKQCLCWNSSTNLWCDNEEGITGIGGQVGRGHGAIAVIERESCQQAVLDEYSTVTLVVAFWILWLLLVPLICCIFRLCCNRCGGRNPTFGLCRPKFTDDMKKDNYLRDYSHYRTGCAKIIALMCLILVAFLSIDGMSWNEKVSVSFERLADQVSTSVTELENIYLTVTGPRYMDANTISGGNIWKAEFKKYIPLVHEYESRIGGVVELLGDVKHYENKYRYVPFIPLLLAPAAIVLVVTLMGLCNVRSWPISISAGFISWIGIIYVAIGFVLLILGQGLDRACDNIATIEDFGKDLMTQKGCGYHQITDEINQTQIQFATQICDLGLWTFFSLNETFGSGTNAPAPGSGDDGALSHDGILDDGRVSFCRSIPGGMYTNTSEYFHGENVVDFPYLYKALTDTSVAKTIEGYSLMECYNSKKKDSSRDGQNHFTSTTTMTSSSSTSSSNSNNKTCVEYFLVEEIVHLYKNYSGLLFEDPGTPYPEQMVTTTPSPSSSTPSSASPSSPSSSGGNGNGGRSTWNSHTSSEERIGADHCALAQLFYLNHRCNVIAVDLKTRVQPAVCGKSGLASYTTWLAAELLGLGGLCTLLFWVWMNGSKRFTTGTSSLEIMEAYVYYFGENDSKIRRPKYGAVSRAEREKRYRKYEDDEEDDGDDVDDDRKERSKNGRARRGEGTDDDYLRDEATPLILQDGEHLTGSTQPKSSSDYHQSRNEEDDRRESPRGGSRGRTGSPRGGNNEDGGSHLRPPYRAGHHLNDSLVGSRRNSSTTNQKDSATLNRHENTNSSSGDNKKKISSPTSGGEDRSERTSSKIFQSHSERNYLQGAVVLNGRTVSDLLGGDDGGNGEGNNMWSDSTLDSQAQFARGGGGGGGNDFAPPSASQVIAGPSRMLSPPPPAAAEHHHHAGGDGGASFSANSRTAAPPSQRAGGEEVTEEV